MANRVMLLHALALIVLLAPAPLSAQPADDGAAPAAGGPWLSPAGRWTFRSGAATWSIDVPDSGRIHAEAERDVLIRGERATYVSTLSGTVSHDRVALSIAAHDFSLPNFVPGPTTICTGVPAGPGRYEGSCANGDQRMRFAFTRD